jgi:hypothetical protein
MSKHIGRKDRWTQVTARRYTSALGPVFYEQSGWYALLSYQIPDPEADPAGPPKWVAHEQRLGPFKRPRNAMVALEREATVLRRRHGSRALIAGQLWAETQR